MKKHAKREITWLLGLSALALYASNQKRAALGLAGLAGAIALIPTPTVKFKGRSAVITGGSRGLGLALAKELMRQGCNVTLLARDKEELERAELILQTIPGAQVQIVPCDVTIEKQVEHAFQKAEEKFGGIDLLINNAGSILVGPWETMAIEDFKAEMELHVYAPITTTRLALPYLRKSGSAKRIVNICSMGGKVAVPHMLPYDTSKFALAGFSQGVAAELAKEGICVTTVYPAVMRTGSPIQAVFKGDHEKEFAWFQTGDILPFLSASAESVARQVVRAARDGRDELLPSLPARARMMIGAFFPELMAQSMATLNSFMPEGTSKEYQTGAQSRELFDQSKWTQPLVERAHQPEKGLNQEPKTDARFNLGLKT